MDKVQYRVGTCAHSYDVHSWSKFRVTCAKELKDAVFEKHVNMKMTLVSPSHLAQFFVHKALVESWTFFQISLYRQLVCNLAL